MDDLGMKAATFLAVAVVAITSIPLLAQQTKSGSNADASAAACAKGAAGFGDESASHAWEMSSINGELEGKLDSKTAKVDDRVVLKTTEKVQTSDGTFIPKGSHLVGHITEVQAYDRDRGGAAIGIAFDRVELKDGQSLGIYTLIRGARAGATPTAMTSMSAADTMGAPMGGGEPMGGQAMGGGRGAGLPGEAGGAVNGTGMAGGTVARTTDATGDVTGAPLSEQPMPMVSSNTSGAVQLAGHGDMDTNPSAHQAAAMRALPRPTGIPGVMLSGNSTASGLFSCSRQNIHLESGTQMQLGIVAD